MEQLAARIPSRGEIAADGVIHALALVAATAGGTMLIALAATYQTPLAVLAVSIYVAGLVLMFSCSAVYNLARKSRRRELYQRLDHACIFLMIAGTYTPFTVFRLQGDWAVLLTALVWSIALLGIALKLWRPRALARASTLIYILLGWIGIVAIEPLFAALGVPILTLLAIGGALYCIGTIFHHWERLPYQNAIWHGFVLAAAGVHYGAIVIAVV